MLTLTLFIFILTTTTTTTTGAAAAVHPTTQTHNNRRILHQPFFPLNSLSPTSQPPLQSPKSQPEPEKQHSEYPFSSQSPPSTQLNFFPSYPSPPPPPPQPSTATSLPTFPANISSLSLPQTSSVSKPISKNLLAVAISVSLSVALIVGVAVFFLYHRKHHFSFVDKKVPRSDSLRLFPPNTAISDGGHKPPGPQPAPRNVNSTSSEFLYLGTLVNSRGIDEECGNRATSSSDVHTGLPVGYQKLGSPELHPLPPLPKQHFRQTYRSSEMGSLGDAGDENDDVEEEFFSPRASSVGKRSPEAAGMDCRREFQAVETEHFGNRSSNSRTASYPSSNSVSPSPSLSSSPSILFNLSPRSIISKSPDSIVNFPAPPRPIPPPPPRERKPRSPSPPSSPPERTSGDTQNSPARFSDVSGLYSHYRPVKLSPSPPPLPPERYWETPVTGPPVFLTPSNPFPVEDPSQNFESGERNVEILKPKLKPLHWDKVRASSERAMVWDQLKSSSFQ